MSNTFRRVISLAPDCRVGLAACDDRHVTLLLKLRDTGAPPWRTARDHPYISSAHPLPRLRRVRRDDARNQLEELIARDANRASVILWGVGNENADTDARLAFMAELARAARATDPSRLVTAACLINREQFRIEDRLAEHLDVIGLNKCFGRYEQGFQGLQRLLANSRPDRPVIISETGADARPGYRDASAPLFSEERQAAFYEGQCAALEQAGYVRGLAGCSMISAPCADRPLRRAASTARA